MTPHDATVVVLEPPFVPSACEALHPRQQAMRLLASAMSGLAQGYDHSARDDVRGALYILEAEYARSREG